MVTLERIHEDDLFISQSRYQKMVLQKPGIEYLKKEFALRGGSWSGIQVAPIWRRERGKVLLLGHSDDELAFSTYLMLRLIGGYKKVASTHLTKNYGSKSRALPLGLPYEEGFGYPFDVLGDSSVLRAVFQQTPPADFGGLRIFGAFSENTHTLRKPLKTLIMESQYGYWRDYPVSKEGRTRYLSDMRQFGLTVCPQGRGVDTYRFWEAIYVGAVPIILRPPKPYLEMIRGLPYIELESWGELRDFSRLQHAWGNLKGETLDFASADITQVIAQYTGA